ncbi:hypothetical protein M8J76_001611 [Diaphorina citri]|nr:hypothetical protein M8J76_001611 [Diaphorina citri]
MDLPLVVSTTLLLLLLSISSTKSDDQEPEPSPSESGYSGIFQSVKQHLFGSTIEEGETDGQSSSGSEVKDSPSDSSVYSYVRSIPLIKYDVNVTFDKSKLNDVVSSIGKTTSDIKKATTTVLKAPLDVLSTIKNTTSEGITKLKERSENATYTEHLLNIANAIPIINQFGPKITEIRDQIQFIKPGTKWCGTGDIARDISDTGIFHDIDSCCRDHDLCPENIVAKSTKYNLTNDGSFTRSSCDCDFNFYKCLKEAANPLAIEVGIAYFDILKPMCFRFDFPRIGCKKFFGDTEQCAEFEMDLTKAKKWQWFPSPSFAL